VFLLAAVDQVINETTAYEQITWISDLHSNIYHALKKLTKKHRIRNVNIMSLFVQLAVASIQLMWDTDCILRYSMDSLQGEAYNGRHISNAFLLIHFLLVNWLSVPITDVIGNSFSKQCTFKISHTGNWGFQVRFAQLLYHTNYVAYFV